MDEAFPVMPIFLSDRSAYNEFRRLFDAALLLDYRRSVSQLQSWSRWRRRHQYRSASAAIDDEINNNDHDLRL